MSSNSNVLSLSAFMLAHEMVVQTMCRYHLCCESPALWQTSPVLRPPRP